MQYPITLAVSALALVPSQRTATAQQDNLRRYIECDLGRSISIEESDERVQPFVRSVDTKEGQKPVAVVRGFSLHIAYAGTPLNGTRNVWRLREGDCTQDLIGTRPRVNVSPDLQVNSHVQYDNESDTFGANARLRWTFSPLGDPFVVCNHDLRHDIDPSTGLPLGGGGVSDPTRRLDRRWGFASDQLLVKLQYAFRY